MPRNDVNNLEDEAVNLTKQLGRQPDLRTAADILTWQVGDLQKAVTYAEWHPNLKPAYGAEAKLALGSIVLQVAVCAKLLDTSLEEIIQLGVDSIKDRIEDYKNHKGRFADYDPK